LDHAEGLTAQVSGLHQKLDLKTKEFEKEKTLFSEMNKKFEDLKILKEKVFFELETKKKEAAELSRQLSEEKQKRKDLERKLSQAEKQVYDLQEEAKQVQESTQGMKERLERMANRFERTESEKTALLERLKQTSQERDQLQKELKELQNKDRPDVTLEAITISEEKSYAGLVLNVNEKFNFCMVSIGKEDGIVSGIELIVHRGRELVGRIKIERVFNRMSSAKILSLGNNQNVQVEDQVRKF
jgi:chromosome segregation protein